MISILTVRFFPILLLPILRVLRLFVRRQSLSVNFCMTLIRTITSRDNSQYRYVRSLHDRKNAEREGVVFLEGVRLCEDALHSGLNPIMVLFSSEKEALAANWCKRLFFRRKQYHYRI